MPNFASLLYPEAKILQRIISKFITVYVSLTSNPGKLKSIV